MLDLLQADDVDLLEDLDGVEGVSVLRQIHTAECACPDSLDKLKVIQCQLHPASLRLDEGKRIIINNIIINIIRSWRVMLVMWVVRCWLREAVIHWMFLFLAV